jgi:4-hydroxy-3-polyprenylbenzoate decarboxylase
VALVRCRTVELDVPAEAELVLEGFVDPDAPGEATGPIAMPGGHFLPSRVMPVVQVSAITHRSNPILPAIVPGSGVDEASTIERALHRVFLPLVQMAVPELVDYDLPAFGAAGRVALVSMTKSYAGQARKVASALWGLRQLMFVKLLVVVDADVEVRDPEQVWSAVATEVDFGRDVVLQSGPPDLRDPAAMPGALGQRMLLDATRKLPEEGDRQSPAAVEMPEELRRLVSRRWSEYGLGDLR